jgi:hypothetical protein
MEPQRKCNFYPEFYIPKARILSVSYAFDKLTAQFFWLFILLCSFFYVLFLWQKLPFEETMERWTKEQEKNHPQITS